MTALDVDLASQGYLRSHDGRFRYVPGLEVIARDAAALGVRVHWGEPAAGRPGESRLWTWTIVLASWLFDCDNARIRDVLSHEVCHCVAGASCERARWLQARLHGDVLAPAWEAA